LCCLQAEETTSQVLAWLKIEPSAQSLDYVNNQKQFQLHTLLTEQRHPKTWSLSFRIKQNTSDGLAMLFSVDEDIVAKFEQLAQDTKELERAAQQVEKAIRNGRTIYVYGCGATGRLAKQMESAFWRPFWRKVRKTELWPKIKHVPDNIENLLIGEMTGADRALISSLEGFEDLQLIGHLQAKDRGIQKGDLVFCVTEGGETSSVIGTILAALKQYGELKPEVMAEARQRLYFIYNNPDQVLLPFTRSKTVIEQPAITKLRLFTGPQAITGSTRMQATTSETFIMGIILEHAIHKLLQRSLNATEMAQLGFTQEQSMAQRLKSFAMAQKTVSDHKDAIAQFSDLEAKTYAGKRFSTYFAGQSLITVFIDSTERSPTFRLFPLDTVNELKRKCWIQVWTIAKDSQEAWQNFLGRAFYGLDPRIYEEPFSKEVSDTYLREAALRSLKKGGHEQKDLYDFAFAESNIRYRAPQEGDLGVLVASDEEIAELANPDSPFCRFIKLCQDKMAYVTVILVGGSALTRHGAMVRKIREESTAEILVTLPVSDQYDPMGLRREIALKMLLNAHSTAVMAKLGRVIGNTMTSVSPSNLKLVGRATYLILAHVNDVLAQQAWQEKYGKTAALTYAEANAVLFDAIDFQTKNEKSGETAEVAMTIIRILETYKKKGFVSQEEVLDILQRQGLENYLLAHNPAMRK
jgi:N-acetylmuramic acid 6-phosphate (MurNAc-6-P) etherase